MPAPSGITWGSISGDLGRLGIYTKLTTTATETIANVQVWLWTKGPCEDTNGKDYVVKQGDNLSTIAARHYLSGWWTLANYNNLKDPYIINPGQTLKIPPNPNVFYYDAGPNATAATTSKGATVDISNTSTTEWSTSNQTLLLSMDYRHNRAASDVTHKVFAKVTNAPYAGGTADANVSYTVPKLASYVVKFDANGGSGAPSNQTKYHGIDLELSKATPTRTGYAFMGWSTSKSGNVLYQPGSSYTSNAALTLYAIWRQNEFTVKFDANGGENAPSNQTKYYGVNLAITNEVPNKLYHNFLGWALSSGSTSVVYSSGDIYTENQSITLYAVWEVAYEYPKIANAKAYRCNENGIATDEGTYAKVTFDWECYETDGVPTNQVQEVVVAYKEPGTTGSSVPVNATGLSGSSSVIVGNGDLDIEKTYTIIINVRDVFELSEKTLPIPDLKFPIDVLKRNKGISFGKNATRENTAEIAYTLKPIGNRYAAASRGTTEVDGYVKLARIEITDYSANWPITFVLTSRLKMSPMTVHIRFNSSTSNDVITSSLDTIKYEGSNYNAYVVPEVEGGSVWNLFVKKSVNNDTITVQDWWMSKGMENRCTVSFFEITPDNEDVPDTLYNELPKPFYKATPLVPQHILDSFFPVGFVLTLFSNTANPNNMYPGTTWERINNAFLWACDDKGAIDGTVMGSKTKTLTVANLPAHTHGSTYTGNASTKSHAWLASSTTKNMGYEAISAGEGEPFNIMPPYVQVAVWRRTA